MRMMIGALFCAALLVTGPVRAEVSPEEKMCEGWEGVAGAIMKYRQTGVSMSDLMSALPENAVDNEAVKELVVRAFDIPRYEVEEDRVEATQDFKDQVYIECAMATWLDD